MGLFDFLRKKSPEPKKEAAETPPDAELRVQMPSGESGTLTGVSSDGTAHVDLDPEPGRPTGDGYFGDLNKTVVMSELFAVPREQRDEKWIKTFFANVADASFCCENPQVIQGPDGFPYVRLTMPEAGKSFTCYVIRHMIPQFLLEKGFGIAINPDKEQPDWIFSYGDLVNFHIHGAFDAKGFDFNPAEAKPGEEENIAVGTKITTGNPSEKIIPIPSRAVLRAFFEAHGVSPKIMLMSRGDGLDLVIPATPDSFSDPDHYQYFCAALRWFLPGYYGMIATKESDEFFDL